ncbi:hypothetical protein DFR70_12863 [Nocardia tenerifensis]|uniref:Uncharacterized protein n=1 Tax=Nocardia tenerifensis TaxID=228006 RepID=A0A318JSG3_9NOCA|nr:hypothetical protein [Nocardia tenerifensis]PXX53350.1 hypothetical protein DFR70_12863 [Nocardia tenerifensis]
MGNLSIVEAADAADITDYLDEVAEVSVSRAKMQHQLLGMAFRLAVLGRAIHTSENPMPHVLCPVRKPTVPHPITRQQAQDMYRYIN